MNVADVHILIDLRCEKHFSVCMDLHFSSLSICCNWPIGADQQCAELL